MAILNLRTGLGMKVGDPTPRGRRKDIDEDAELKPEPKVSASKVSLAHLIRRLCPHLICGDKNFRPA